MKLPREDGLLFYKLFPALMFYTNERLKIVDKMASEFEEKNKEAEPRNR